MSSVIRYYMVENDTKRTLANQLLVDGSGLVLTGYTVECHMTNTSTDAVTTITSVTPDADQVSNPKLAEGLRRKGEAGLHAAPSMSRFEATLRAYCVGFLAGRRSKDPPLEHRDDALPTDG